MEEVSLDFIMIGLQSQTQQLTTSFELKENKSAKKLT